MDQGNVHVSLTHIKVGVIKLACCLLCRISHNEAMCWMQALRYSTNNITSTTLWILIHCGDFVCVFRMSYLSCERCTTGFSMMESSRLLLLTVIIISMLPSQVKLHVQTRIAISLINELIFCFVRVCVCVCVCVCCVCVLDLSVLADGVPESKTKTSSAWHQTPKVTHTQTLKHTHTHTHTHTHHILIHRKYSNFNSFVIDSCYAFMCCS